MPHDPGSLPLNTFRPRASPCGQRRTMQSTNEQRDFRPFIPECAKRGIGKTKAYELDDAGLLETFTIGTKRYVYLDSLLRSEEHTSDLQSLLRLSSAVFCLKKTTQHIDTSILHATK